MITIQVPGSENCEGPRSKISLLVSDRLRSEHQDSCGYVLAYCTRSQYLEWLQLDMGRCSIVARGQPWLDLENIHQRRTLSGAQCALMNEITPTFLAVRPERKLAKSLGSRERAEWETGWKDDADVNVVSLLADWGWSPSSHSIAFSSCT